MSFLQNELDSLLQDLPENIYLWVAFAICLLILVSELYKYIRYRTHGDMLDLAIMGTTIIGIFILTDNLLLSILSTLFIMMVEGAYEVRENPVWLRLLLTFTATYGWLLGCVILSEVTGDEIWFGIGLNSSLWIMLIMGFIFFGRKYIIISRFASPQYVYLFLFALFYIIIFGGTLSEESPLWDARYVLIFGVNIFIYMISGPLLRILFGIKTLENERALRLIEEVREKFNVKLTHVGIVEAPIINAFAYGSFFDRRIALIIKDIDDFTDEEIKGIVAHELAHSKKNHTMWLLVLGFIELMIKMIAEMPANQLEYIFATDNPDYIIYYLFNLSIFIVLVIFVRIMEGTADRMTKELGYGKDLSQSLYRLESFYQGIAGEIGLDAQLLSETKRTETEEILFSGKSAEGISSRLMNPSRIGLLFNLIASHPPTAFRLAALEDNEITPIRLSLFTFSLTLPRLRGRNIKYLQRNRDQVAKVVQEKYQEKADSVNSYVKLLPNYQILKQFEGKNVIAISKYKKESPICGKLRNVNITPYVMTPIELEIETLDQSSTKINFSDWEIKLGQVDGYYILKNQEKVKLTDIEYVKGKIKYNYIKQTKKGNIKYNYTKKTKKGKNKITKNYLGIPLSMFPIQNSKALMQSKGKTISVDILDFNENAKFWKSTYKFKIGDEEKSIDLKSMIAIMPPNLILLPKKHWKQHIDIFNELKSTKSCVTLYTNQDLEIGIPAYIEGISHDSTETNAEKDNLIISFGTERREIKARDLESMFVYYPYLQFYMKKEIGAPSIMGMKLRNWRKNLKYALH